MTRGGKQRKDCMPSLPACRDIIIKNQLLDLQLLEYQHYHCFVRKSCSHSSNSSIEKNRQRQMKNAIFRGLCWNFVDHPGRSKFITFMRFHAWNHMVPYDYFMLFPCMESHGIIWFHAWNRMESYGSIHGHVWNHLVSCMESHGMI